MSRSTTTTMTEHSSSMAQQLAEAASAFEQRMTGQVPKSATVVLRDSTLVITLHSALSLAERAVARTPVNKFGVSKYA